MEGKGACVSGGVSQINQRRHRRERFEGEIVKFVVFVNVK